MAAVCPQPCDKRRVLAAGRSRRGREQVGEDLAGDAALAAAHDLGLGLPLGGAAGDGLPGGRVAAQRTRAMRHKALLAWRSPPRCSRCRSVRPQETGIGAAPHSRAKDASERSRSRLSPAVTSSCPAVSAPTPGRASSCGAVAVTSGASWESRSSISACSACQRRARARSAVLTAEAGSLTGPGRRAAQARMRCLDVSLRNRARTCSGAVRIRASIWAPAWTRRFIAPRRATRRTRIISTCASRDFGSRWPVPTGQRGRPTRHRGGRTCRCGDDRPGLGGRPRSSSGRSRQPGITAGRGREAPGLSRRPAGSRAAATCASV